jgi:PAS domain S-box-containing protein
MDDWTAADSLAVGDPILDAAPDAVITIEADGTIVAFNSAAERIFAVDRTAAMGRLLGDLIVPEPQRLAHEAGLRRVVEGGTPRIMGRHTRLCAQRADGREIIVELYLTRTSETPPRFTAWIREVSEDEVDRADEADRRALLEAGEELASVGSWEWTPSRGKLLWSDNVYRILGLRLGEVTPDPQIITGLTHPDDRDRVRKEQQLAAASGELRPVTYRIVRPDGEVRHLRTSLTVAERGADGEPYRLVGFVQDLTDRRRARREIAAHVSAAQAMARWTTFDEGAQELLAGLADALDCEAAILWLPVKTELVARLVWRDGTADASVLDDVKPGTRLRRAGDVASRAWRQREAAGTRCGVAVPAVLREDVLALVELRSRTGIELPDPLLRSLTGIGYELGQFLGRRRAELAMPVLTPRELEVLALAAQGLSAREIGERLVIGTATVRTHFENLYPKLAVSERAAAVAAALRLGLIE